MKQYTRVKDRQSALRLYRRVINEFNKGMLDDKKAYGLARLLDGYLKAEKDYKLDEIEERLKQFESELRDL